MNHIEHIKCVKQVWELKGQGQLPQNGGVENATENGLMQMIIYIGRRLNK